MRLATPTALLLLTLSATTVSLSIPRALAKIVLTGTLLGGPPVYAEQLVSNSIPRLTARDLLTSDVSSRTAALSEILFTFRLYQPILENRPNYATIIRSQLRTEPAKSLRQTCKSLRKVLASAELQAKFDSYYDGLISAIADLDTECLRIEQKGEAAAESGRPLVAAELKKIFVAFDALVQVAASSY